jgi:voltage-gated potassium channel
MPRTPAWLRIQWSLGALAMVWLAAASLLRVLGHGRWSFGECFYFAGITIFTVGYGEIRDIERVAGARPAVLAIVVLGVGAVTLVQASVTAAFIEGVVVEAVRRNRMRKNIEAMRGHVVVAGAGSTGRFVIEELWTTRRPFVVIDRDEAHLREVSEEVCKGEMRYVVGDATHDHALTAAGIAHAGGVVAALTDDADNLYVTLSARALNAHARIVSKAVTPEAVAKMRRAGANAVVSPNTIGGRRMASELVRPEVVEFLDQMHRADHSLRMEEVTVSSASPLVGRALREAPLRPRTRALIVAIRSERGLFRYNPGPEALIEAGTTLVALGDVDDIRTLREIVEQG